eukprot:1194341-Prorocentrum_minimum.AAC.5
MSPAHLEREADAEVLASHADNAPAVAVHQHHGVVRKVPGQPEEGRLQVALVPRQVEERQHLIGPAVRNMPPPLARLVRTIRICPLPSCDWCSEAGGCPSRSRRC